jgi:two-component system, NtrC family, sensor kinase
VKDEGGGIAPEHLSLLFEPFFSNKKDGHGIGLAVSYSIIEAHGGKIDVQSEYGVGAEFKVSLPLL